MMHSITHDRAKTDNGTKYTGIRILAVFFWIAIWQFASMYLKQEILLASPVSVVRKLFELIFSGNFWQSVGFSFVRIVTGFLLAVLLGIFLAVWANLKSLKQNRYFKTWMIRILINKCKDMIQKKKLVTYTDQMPETPFHEEKYAAMEWIQALEPLDSKYRLVVLLYYMEGFGIREISDILDMKESTVKSRLYRGRKQIAEMYGYKVKEGRA